MNSFGVLGRAAGGLAQSIGLGILLLALSVGIGFAAAQQPVILLAALGLSIVIWLACRWPEGAGLLFLFIMYTNTGPILTRFHGAPKNLVSALILALVIIPVGYAVLYRRQPVVLTSTLPWVLGFAAVQGLGAIFSDFPGWAQIGFNEIVLEGLLIYFLVSNAIRTPETLRQACWVLVIAGILLGAAPLYQQITGDFDNHLWGYGQIEGLGFLPDEEAEINQIRQPRFSGVIGEQNRFAQIMLMLVPLAFFRLLDERSWGLKLLAFTGGIMSSIGWVLTFSRGAAVAFILTCLAAVALRTIQLRHFLYAMLLGVLLVAAFPQFIKRLDSMKAVETLATNTVSTEEDRPDGAIMGRLTVMLAAAQVYADHPIVGVGPGLYQFYARDYGNKFALRHLTTPREAHNLVLGVLAETGTLGFAALAIALFITFKSLHQARRRWQSERPVLAGLITGVMLALVSYLATGLFLHFAYIRYFWLMMGLAGAAISISKNLELEAKEGQKVVNG